MKTNLPSSSHVNQHPGCCPVYTIKRLQHTRRIMGYLSFWNLFLWNWNQRFKETVVDWQKPKLKLYSVFIEILLAFVPCYFTKDNCTVTCWRLNSIIIYIIEMFRTYNSAWASLKIICENLAYTLIPKKETGLLKFYNKSHFPMCQLNIVHI